MNEGKRYSASAERSAGALCFSVESEVTEEEPAADQSTISVKPSSSMATAVMLPRFVMISALH